MLEKSYLIPALEPQKINIEIWDEHTSDEHKFELYDGIPFGEDFIERDRLLICLLYSCGYKHLFSILDPESLAVLKHAAQKITSTDQMFQDKLKYLEDLDKVESDHVSRMQAAEEEWMKRSVTRTVKKLLSAGYSDVEIANRLELSIEQVKELKE